MAPTVSMTESETKMVDNESHPWSKSSPSGDWLPVRRACLPSIASSVWTPSQFNINAAVITLSNIIISINDLLNINLILIL